MLQLLQPPTSITASKKKSNLKSQSTLGKERLQSAKGSSSKSSEEWWRLQWEPHAEEAGSINTLSSQVVCGSQSLLTFFNCRESLCHPLQCSSYLIMLLHCTLWRAAIDMDEISLLSTCLLRTGDWVGQRETGWMESAPAAIWSQSADCCSQKWGCPLFHLPALHLLLLLPLFNWQSSLRRRAISFLIQSDGCQLAAHILADCNHSWTAETFPWCTKQLHFCKNSTYFHPT